MSLFFRKGQDSLLACIVTVSKESGPVIFSCDSDKSSHLPFKCPCCCHLKHPEAFIYQYG